MIDDPESTWTSSFRNFIFGWFRPLESQFIPVIILKSDIIILSRSSMSPAFLVGSDFQAFLPFDSPFKPRKWSKKDLMSWNRLMSLFCRWFLVDVEFRKSWWVLTDGTLSVSLFFFEQPIRVFLSSELEIGWWFKSCGLFASFHDALEIIGKHVDLYATLTWHSSNKKQHI